MKKFGFIFLAVSLFCGDVFAQTKNDDANFGALAGAAANDSEESGNIFKPSISSRLIAEGAFDHNYQSTNSSDEFKESQARLRFYSTINLSKKLAVNLYVKTEKTEGANETRLGAGSDHAFKNNAIVTEELNLNYSDKNYAVIAGKFNLNFGTAWKWNRGLWTHQVADNYREREKLGFSGVLHLGDRKKTGQYSFGLAAFTNDRKNLDGTIGSDRDSETKSQGAPGGARGLESYLASLDINFDFGKKFGSEEKLSYHFSYINLAVNKRASPLQQSKIDDQKGFAAGLNYKYPWAENFTIDGVLEYASIKNLDGNSDINENYLTANVISKIYQNWLFILGYSQRQNIEANQNGFDQNLSEISFGYQFGKNSFFDKLTLQAGYKNQRTDFKTSLDTQNVYGVLVRYYKNF